MNGCAGKLAFGRKEELGGGKLGWRCPKEGKFLCDGNGGDGEGRRIFKGEDGRVRLLFLGHVGIGQRDGKKGFWGCGNHRDLGKVGSGKGVSYHVAVARKVEKGNLKF